MDVVILAAGKGQRFGAPKQFTPVGPKGQTLLELCADDARRAGSRRAVIVTSPELEDELHALIARHPIPRLEVRIAIQRLDDLPLPLDVSRDKPWGTAHAVWTVRGEVKGPFLLFNADDYYGPNAPAVLAACLCRSSREPRFVLLSYPLGMTLSSAGTVSRALCVMDDKNCLTGLREYLAIDSEGQVHRGERAGTRLSLSAPVSMNAWGFTPAVFPLIERYLLQFLASANLKVDECFLPSAIEAGIQGHEVEVQVAEAPDRWCGLTWPKDRERVAQHLAEIDAARSAAVGFGLDGRQRAPAPFGTGLIHGTWRMPSDDGGHLLQQINETVFPDPVAVVENAVAAAQRIDDSLHRLGDPDPRHRVGFLRGPDGKYWLRDSRGHIWRCMVAIAGARPANPSRSSEIVSAARALGRFPGLVAEGRGPNLCELLPGFHDTAARFRAFEAALVEDAVGLRMTCANECDRVLGLATWAQRLPPDALQRRLIHNDAKLDNVLVDELSGEALCVIDLDTVMPGLAPHDFGDLVRASVTGRREDEADLTAVRVRVKIFQDLARGYIEGSRDWLTPQEQDCLVDGVLVITFEQALRFLTDYLCGDMYYRVEDHLHNLRRARTQLHLFDELLALEDDLRRIVSTA